ncbi:SURF1 family protein [Amphritea sp. 1_MG-2023]|uniref:SURF1 family protein n=1 Tax=Amphritea sp. 1_MG-2023 TaxID=3062670 RepID=UPI0026E43F8A|nr:SURF1 family protein [Amphritea sp. 1_MG-2023]MDO6563866.1 SURF1 family protein [Amphritea sp. 1_MG-2023]
MSKVQRIPLSKWLMIILALLLIALLLWLGGWQLQRAKEKQQLLEQWNRAHIDLTVLPNPDHAEAVGVKLAGYFLTDVIYLLDNRTREGQVGYEVVVVFRIDKAEQRETPLVLINLGWIKGSQYRDQLPAIELPDGPQEIVGRLITPLPAVQLHSDDWQDAGHVRIQQLDMARLSARHPNLYPAIMRIDKPLLPQLSVGWPVVRMSPQRHIGYAVQWFGLAMVLMVGCGWLIWQQRRERL